MRTAPIAEGRFSRDGRRDVSPFPLRRNPGTPKNLGCPRDSTLSLRDADSTTRCLTVGRRSLDGERTAATDAKRSHIGIQQFVFFRRTLRGAVRVVRQHVTHETSERPELASAGGAAALLHLKPPCSGTVTTRTLQPAADTP